MVLKITSSSDVICLSQEFVEEDEGFCDCFIGFIGPGLDWKWDLCA